MGTELIEQYSELFDADGAIAKMMSGSNWPRDGYKIFKGMSARPMTEKEIKAKWDFDRQNAANRGTYMHHIVEWMLADPRTMGFISEIRNLLDLLDGGLAATIDYVGRLPDGTFVIIDWKRSKELKREAFGGQMMKEPFSMLPDSNLGHYELQINLYKMLLLRNYRDVIQDVSKMLIVILHPNCYEVVEARDLRLGVVNGQILPHQES